MANLVPVDSRTDLMSPRPPAETEPGYPGGQELHLRELLSVLRRNWVLISGVALVAGGLASWAAVRKAPQYKAVATIRLKNERQALTGGIESDALDQMVGKTVDPLLSQLQVLRSRSVAKMVVDRASLRLNPLTPGFSLSAIDSVSADPDARWDTVSIRFSAAAYTLTAGPQRSTASYGKPVSVPGLTLTVASRPKVSEATLVVLPEGRAVDKVTSKLTAHALEKTDVVQIEYVDTDPRVAKRVANAAVEAFQSVNARESQQQSRRRRLFLEEQLSKTDSVLASAQLQLSGFRRREEVYSSRDKFAAEQAGIIQMDARREELEADQRVYKGLLASLNRSKATNSKTLRTFISAPGLSSNPIVAQLYTQLLQYQTAKDSLTAGPWGSAAQNPDVQRLNSLMASTEQRLVDALQSHVAALDARIKSLDEMKARNTVEIQGLPDKEAEEMRLTQQVETATKLADQLREEYQKARIAEAVEVGQVEIVDLAAMPITPIGSGRAQKIILGILLGLIVGSAVAFLKEHLNTKVQRKDELEPLLRVPSLAVIPRIAQDNTGSTLVPKLRLALRAASNHGVERPLERLVTLSEGRSSGAEAYRSLRTNLLFSQTAHGLKRVLVTSAMAAEGKTTTAANLAVTFAQQGKNVLLIDGDLRKARLHRVFGVTKEPGLVDVLVGHVALDQAIRPTPVAGLCVIAAGTLPPNPSELLGSMRMRQLLDELSNDFDMIILDAPPVLVAGDASIISALADGTIIVVRAGQTDRAAALAAVQQLQAVGGNVLGAVLNDPDAKVVNYEGYYYYAYNYYGEEEDAIA